MATALEETHTEISRALAEDGAERIVGLQQQRVAGMEGVRALRERENQCTKAVDTVKKDNFELRQVRAWVRVLLCKHTIHYSGCSEIGVHLIGVTFFKHKDLTP